jgi:hypothetical protein
MGSHLSPQFCRLALSSLCVIGIFAAHCQAPQPPSEPKLRDRGPLAEKYLHQRLPFWQQRLHLQDWKVTVLSVHPTDLRPNTMGNIHWDKEKKTGVIRVLDASDYRMPYQAALNDMEFTVVHELIHLELASLPRSEASRSDEEHAINHLASALLQFEHKYNPVASNQVP